MSEDLKSKLNGEGKGPIPPMRTDIMPYLRAATGVDEEGKLNYIEAFSHPEAEWKITELSNRIASGDDETALRLLNVSKHKLRNAIDNLSIGSYHARVTDAKGITAKYNSLVTGHKDFNAFRRYVRDNYSGLKDHIADLKYEAAVISDIFQSESYYKNTAMDHLRTAMFESLWLLEAVRTSDVKTNRVQCESSSLQNLVEAGILRLQIHERFGTDIMRTCRHMGELTGRRLPELEAKIDLIGPA